MLENLESKLKSRMKCQGTELQTGQFEVKV